MAFEIQQFFQKCMVYQTDPYVNKNKDFDENLKSKPGLEILI